MGSAPAEASASEASPTPESRFSNLRSVRWRIDLGILPSSPSASIDDLRRATADTRRRYASMRRRLLIAHHGPKDGDASPDLTMDNPLSQNPDSTWGRFFSYAELAKMVDQDLCRLYPEHSSYFHTPKCQAILRRVLSFWCLQHPEYGYRQGMHELLAPLVYVLHVDLDHLVQVRKLYEDCYSDEFNEMSIPQSNLLSNGRIINWDSDMETKNDIHKMIAVQSLDELDPDTRENFLLSDPYGAEGELGVVLSERFMEHDAYCLFDNLMDGDQGVVAMASFFSPVDRSNTNLPPVIEASSALYHLLSIVDSSLHSHLVELGVEPQYFALRWLRVLFGREFCLDHLVVIWDELFSSSNGIWLDGDVEYNFKVLCSRRGALIAALAVSMLLYLRSSLLASETATSCLQRLLNFPQGPDMKKLLEKAKSLQVVALESNISSSSSQRYSNSNKKLLISRGGSLPSSTALGKPPVSIRPDSYWEEKWRVMQKDEEVKKQSNNVSGATGMMKILTSRLNLSRTKSEPLKGKGPPTQSSVRRRLFDDISMNIEGKISQDKCEFYEAPPVYKSTSSFMVEETSSAGHNSAFLTSASPHQISNEANDPDNESVISSVTSNSFVGDNDGETISVGELCSQNNQNEETNNTEEPCCPNNQHEDTYSVEEPSCKNMGHQAQSAEATSSTSADAVPEQIAAPKDRKLSGGKWQWLWKFGRGSSEGTQDSQQSSSAGHARKDSTDISTCDGPHRSVGVNKRIEVVDKKVIDGIRNLGQSMLENIQVIESVFQQDKGKCDSLENLSSNILGGKGQGTAVAALKELRKISNLLTEM